MTCGACCGGCGGRRGAGVGPPDGVGAEAG